MKAIAKLAATVVVVGIVTACGVGGDPSDTEESTSTAGALTGCHLNACAETTCDFSYLWTCAYPSTKCPNGKVAGLGKGRDLKILAGPDGKGCSVNGYYKVVETNNQKQGWVKGTCMKTIACTAPKPPPPAPPPPKPDAASPPSEEDAGASTEEADASTEEADASDPSPGPASEQALEQEGQEDGASEDGTDPEKAPNARGGKADSSGCSIGVGRVASSPVSLLAILGLPLLAWRSRRRRK